MKYEDIVLADNPELYLPLTETSGDFIDITGNGYDAKVFGTLGRGSTTSTVDGRGGVEVGSNWDGYAICPKPMPWFGGVYSMELWLYPTVITSAWIANGADEQVFAVPGNVGVKTKVNGVGAIAVSGIGGDTALQAGAYKGGGYMSGTSNATIRDDNSYTGNNPRTVYENHTWATSRFLRHYVFRHSAMPCTSVAANRNTTAGGACEVFRNGALVSRIGSGSEERSFNYGHPKYGFGLFGYPSSATTAVNRSRYMWVAHAAIYSYPLTDAQILRHYQAGVGTLSGNRVAGSTLLDGAMAGGFKVFVHRRDTGELIGRTTSDATGYFSCNVGSYSGLVYAVAFDSVSGRYMPAQVFDLITPSV